MMDIAYMPQERQKQLFWALGILMYFPLLIKLVILLANPEMPLAESDVNLLLAIFLAMISMGILVYLFYLVAGPFLAASGSLVARGRRKPARQWFGSDSRRAQARSARPSVSKPRTVDVIKPAVVSKTPIVAHCEFCDEKVYMPYKCRFCEGVFCDFHRLPEKHRCPFI